MSATVIRVKRRVDEEPLNAFVLNSKKRRFENIDDADDDTDAAASAGGAASAHGQSTTVVKFAGTVQNQDDIASHIRKLTKADAINATNHVRRPMNVAARSRTALRQHAQEDRFKIVNCFRTRDDQTLAADLVANGPAEAASGATGGAEPTSRLTVVDIEKSEAAPAAAVDGASNQLAHPIDANMEAASATAAPAANGADAGAEYVYDLYFPDTAEPNSHMDIFIEDLLSIEPLTYGSARDNGLPDTSDDSEDSNDEGNCRNDYPDTEEDDDDDGHDSDSVNEEDMRRAFDSMEMDDELSSDDEAAAVAVPQNAFVYSMAEEESAGGSALHDSDVDEDDVRRYGEAYARYKARVLRRNHRRPGVDDDSDDEYGEGRRGSEDNDDGSDISDVDSSN